MFIIQYMTRPVVTIKSNTPVPKAVDILKSGNFRHLPVVDDSGRLLGMVTDRDLRSAAPSTLVSKADIQKGLYELEMTPVNSLMSKVTITLNTDSTLDDALILFDQERIGAIPVIDKEKRVIGMFSIRDLLTAYSLLFGLGERGSTMIVIEDDGQVEQLLKIIQVLESNEINFTRLIKSKKVATSPARIYLLVNTFNIKGVCRALQEAGLSIVTPQVGAEP
jgi:acetoin utilization protein AcuB